MTDLDHKLANGPGAGWRALVVIGLVGAVWLLVGAGDWYLRFAWYRWQARLIFRPAPAHEAARMTGSFVTHWVPERRGGDLTRLVGIPSFNRRFEQLRPGGAEVYDREGFRNPPIPDDLVPPILVVGDSFMAAGEPMTNMFSVQLAGRVGVPVYNRAMVGVGPFLSLIQFVDSAWFRDRRPKCLIWGFVERDVIRHGFSGLVYQLDIREKKIVPREHLALRSRAERRTLVNWRELTSGQLKTSLPNTSAMAQLSQRAWHRLRYALFGVIHPEVFPSSGRVEGKPLLFYRPALEVALGDPSERDPDQITEAVCYTRDFLGRRGIRLAVVLIPDKETIYRELIPPRELGGREIPPSGLDDLAARIRAEGIPAVSLLGPFREHAARGELLYWPDDTHWNERGIQRAVEETAKTVAPLLHHDGG